MLTQTEENYLKTIYNISIFEDTFNVSTNAIAKKTNTKASSVTDMISKLAEKKLINYVKYQGVSLTKKGLKMTLLIVRKHRLWEVFLVEKLQFKWDEVHDVAEQLEHIQSTKLIDRLDALLNYPTYDPHGDPIPNKKGKLLIKKEKVLFNCTLNRCFKLVGVRDSSVVFLKYLDTLGIQLGTKIKVISKEIYDNSLMLEVHNQHYRISEKTAKNLIVK